jgi:hypothetical protein
VWEVNVTLSWIIAAAGAVAARPAGALASIGVIVLCAYGYMRFGARESGLSHALGVGVAWLVLGIVAEMLMTRRLGHGWYAILGSPDRPLLRNIFLFVWIFAPALFARREENA